MLLVIVVIKGMNVSIFYYIYRYNTVSSPSLAKNAITVGAVNSYYFGVEDGVNYLAYFSSLANPNLKRIKPDVTGVGILTSAKSLSPEDCKNQCQDHADTVLFGGTYPFQ